MQVSFSPLNYSNIGFNGSFKIEDLDALIADFDVDEEETKTKKTEEDKSTKVSHIAKNFNTFSNGEITKIKMWASAQWAIDNHISSIAKNICKKQHVYPSQDLFAIEGLTEDNKRYVLFNSFYKDEETGAKCTQMFYLESEDDKHTQLQKNVFKIMRDSRNKRYLVNTSTCNPLVKFSHGAFGSTEFAPVINAMAEVSKETYENDMIDEKGNFRPIIYTADGEYIRYKHYTYYKKPSQE